MIRRMGIFKDDPDTLAKEYIEEEVVRSNCTEEQAIRTIAEEFASMKIR